MDKLEAVKDISKALTKAFPNGSELFKIISRLAEECGEVAQEINHYERRNVNYKNLNNEDKRRIISELFQVIVVDLQLVSFLDLEKELYEYIDEVHDELISKGLIIR